MDALVIAGYNVLADKPEFAYHQKFIEESFQRAQKEDVDLIITVGGATNPDYPELTEAETAKKIVERFNEEYCLNGYISVVSLPIGNTSAETLRAARNHLNYLKKRSFPVDKLIYCVELARCVGFGMDGLFEGLNELCNELIICGFRLPESKSEFKAQKKKLLIKLLSHQGKVFDLLRRAYQKLHQIRVAQKVRKQIKPPRKS